MPAVPVRVVPVRVAPVVVWLVVWLVAVVVAVVAVVVGSSAGEAVMAVADRALAEADRAVRAVAVPDAGSTDAGSTCRVGSPVRAHARAADASDVSDV